MPKRSEKKKRKNTIKILELRHRKRKFEGSSKLERVKSVKFFSFLFSLCRREDSPKFNMELSQSGLFFLKDHTIVNSNSSVVISSLQMGSWRFTHLFVAQDTSEKGRRPLIIQTSG